MYFNNILVYYYGFGKIRLRILIIILFNFMYVLWVFKVKFYICYFVIIRKVLDNLYINFVDNFIKLN